MDAAWTKFPKEALDYFQVDPDVGLSPAHVEKNVKLYGKNGVLVYFL